MTTTRQPAYRRPESVLVVVYTDALDVLLIKRVRPANFWQSVTGSLDWPDERPAEAARREVFEETGIVTDLGDLHDWQRTEQFVIRKEWASRFPPGVTHNTEHFFSLRLAERPEITLNPEEHTDQRWLPIDDAVDEVASWTNRNALEAIKVHHG